MAPTTNRSGPYMTKLVFFNNPMLLFKEKKKRKEKIQIKTQSRGPHLADRLHFILKQVFENTKDTSNHLGLLGQI